MEVLLPLYTNIDQVTHTHPHTCTPMYTHAHICTTHFCWKLLTLIVIVVVIFIVIARFVIILLLVVTVVAVVVVVIDAKKQTGVKAKFAHTTQWNYHTVDPVGWSVRVRVRVRVSL